MSWFSDVLNNLHYIELDASFKACYPYSFAIFHGIIFNSSIPFAISIGPTENEKLFQFIFEGLEKFKINKEILENKQVLNDMGPSIISFCNSHNMGLNFYHRHIIERFGASSGIGLWVIKMLKCKTLDEFLERRKIRGIRLLDIKTLFFLIHDLFYY